MSQMWKTSGGEMCAGRLEDLLIIIGVRDADNKAWEEWCELALDITRTHGSGRLALSYVAQGRGPSAVQRKMLSDRVPLKFNKSALLSDSAIVRGAFTAFGWFNRAKDFEMKSFKPSEYAAALTWLARDGGFSLPGATAFFKELLVFAKCDPPGTKTTRLSRGA